MKHTDDKRKMNKESERTDWELYILLAVLAITVLLGSAIISTLEKLLTGYLGT